MTDRAIARAAAIPIPITTPIPTPPFSPLSAPTRTQARASSPKLHALTSLRFFAAAMIVMLHSQGYFGTVKALDRFTLTQGVCFFFVLSGFILTYAYPRLDRQRAGRFLVARLARIVPMHVVAFVLYVLVLPEWYRDAVSRNTPGTAALTLTLVQAWVPVYRVQTAFNGVSWSLSVEFFFYLCFPFLLWQWRRTWAVKLALAFGLACAAILVADYGLRHLPAGADARDLVYFFPPARIWEFAVGVAVAHLWQYLRPRLRIGRGFGTAFEVAALGLALVVMRYSGTWAHRAGHRSWIGPGGEAWLASSGLVCLPFAALICLMAFEWGWIARLLSWRPLVLLGEISFSLYLIHLIVCHYYVIHPQPFVAVPPVLLFVGYWAVVLLASYVGWFAVEVPCRRAIVALWDRHIARSATRIRTAARETHSVPGRRFRIAPVAWINVAASGALVLAFASFHVAAQTTLPAPTALATAAPEPTRALIAIDSIGMQPSIGGAPVVVQRDNYPSDTVPVIGWSVDPAEHRPVRGVLVSVDGNPGTWANYGSSRNDVSARLGGTALHSGYVGTISLKDLGNGPHTITVTALIPGANAYAQMQKPLLVT